MHPPPRALLAMPDQHLPPAIPSISLDPNVDLDLEEVHPFEPGLVGTPPPHVFLGEQRVPESSPILVADSPLGKNRDFSENFVAPPTFSGDEPSSSSNFLGHLRPLKQMGQFSSSPKFSLLRNIKFEWLNFGASLV